MKEIKTFVKNEPNPKPFIAKHWAPKDDKNIQPDERVYFTAENAKTIDQMLYYIKNFVEEKYKPYLLGPLLVQCSIHNNTNGQFSAFYKNGEIGAYGGKNKVDTKRITAPIKLMEPIFHKNNTKICRSTYFVCVLYYVRAIALSSADMFFHIFKIIASP